MTTPIQDSIELLRAAAVLLGDKKALDLRAYDARAASSITDYILIATAMNGPHLKALANTLRLNFKNQMPGGGRRSGSIESGWLVVDCFDVMIHLMTKECRAYYALDEMWKNLPAAPLPQD